MEYIIVQLHGIDMYMTHLLDLKVYEYVLERGVIWSCGHQVRQVGFLRVTPVSSHTVPTSMINKSCSSFVIVEKYIKFKLIINIERESQ